MTTEGECRDGPVTIGELRRLFPKEEVIKVSGRGKVYNLYHPEGVDLKDYLDPEHYPTATRFTTVIVSDAFSPLRGAVPIWSQIPPPERQEGAGILEHISDIARQRPDRRHPDPVYAAHLRERYLNSMALAMREVIRANPITKDDVIVPIERCGGNIARALFRPILTPLVSMSAGRLRFRDNQALLGAGTNLENWIAESFANKRIRLIEGVVASGSTEVAVMAHLRNLNINYRAIDCDAVVVCPAGQAFVSDFRKSLRVLGEERSAYIAGVLDSNWYLRYHVEDPLLQRFRDSAGFIGEQVLGDGGDYTTL
jgi:hypothetical protein